MSKAMISKSPTYTFTHCDCNCPAVAGPTAFIPSAERCLKRSLSRKHLLTYKDQERFVYQ